MWQSFKGLVGCAGNVLRNQYHFQMGLDVTAFRGLGSFRTLDLVSHALPFCREAAPVASAALAGAMYRGPMPVVTTLHVLDLGDMMVILVQTARACRGFSTRRNGDL
jgi:hypothetical protein|mmetsp:Transcript_63822/g.106549  ORF Transcript_63822/g.106549 Transcript_63822/m.106549 type:complete len:107 (-) Transcript_63822:2952-3272(-)